jgi:hypothetical protein
METKKYYWTMKDGKKIDVDDMTESHLKNVLKLLLTRNESSAKKLHTHNVSKRCFCGAYFDGIECNSCGFDASEVYIY